MSDASETSPTGTPIHLGPSSKLRMTMSTALSILAAIIVAVWIAARIYAEHSQGMSDIGELKHDAAYLKRCMRTLFIHQGIPIPREDKGDEDQTASTAIIPSGAPRPQ